MPVNKNAYLRYQILDRCFSNKHKRFSFDNLIECVSDKLGYNISPRQIREDIANLRMGPYISCLTTMMTRLLMRLRTHKRNKKSQVLIVRNIRQALPPSFHSVIMQAQMGIAVAHHEIVYMQQHIICSNLT